MKISKGCLNEECEAHNKKTKYKKEDNFCLKCGNPLSIICVDCFCELENEDAKRCVKCQAKRDDSNDRKMKKVAAGGAFAAGGVAILARTIGVAGKEVFKIIKK